MTDNQQVADADAGTKLLAIYGNTVVAFEMDELDSGSISDVSKPNGTFCWRRLCENSAKVETVRKAPQQNPSAKQAHKDLAPPYFHCPWPSTIVM